MKGVDLSLTCTMKLSDWIELEQALKSVNIYPSHNFRMIVCSMISNYTDVLQSEFEVDNWNHKKRKVKKGGE